jgi:predicted nucleotidyltransferase component of viral defense system
MFTYVRSDLEKMSSETGFIQNSLEKVLRLMDILDQISRHPFLKECFVLKGGTALNVFYLDLPRLSVDADLNYVKEVEREGMIKDRKVIDPLLHELINEEYNVTLRKEEYALSQFEFRYDTMSGSKDLIRLDINYLHRLPMMEFNEMEIEKFGSKIKFSQLGLEELIASKLIAFLSRYTPRDLFDLYQLALQNSEIDKHRLSNLIIYYGIISRESIFSLFELKLESISDRSIRTQLYPMLTKNNRPDFNDLNSTVEQFLNPFIQLNTKQTNIIENFYASGILNAPELFDDKEFSKKILKSPNFIWKSENIKQKS